MSETLLGWIIAGAAALIVVPMILNHYFSERRRDRILRRLEERQTAIWECTADKP
jgi:hypothetical protein